MARRQREPETAPIASVTHDGRGIAAVEGKKVFVAGALAGETVRFLRRKRRRNFDEAELLEVLEAAPDRVEPRCAVYGSCGGCSLQHQAPERQREIKFAALKDAFARIGGVTPARWLEPLGADAGDGSWHYRRRARLAVKDVPAKGRVLVGFREKHAPFVTDMQRCEVLARPAHALLPALSELVASLTVRARLPQIEVAVGDAQVRLVFRVLDPPTAADRERFVDFARRHEVTVALQPGGLDSVENLWPGQPEPLYYELPEFDVRLEFEATDFVQVNGAVNRRLVGRALELLAPEAGERVLDLYCGIGNFSLPLARRSAAVLGVEGEARQVARARVNAALNVIDNAEFLAADLSALDGSERWLRRGWDRVLLDPARSGALEFVRVVDRAAPRRIVYVSCHPATLARDAAELAARGYRASAAGIVDMFPHTGHVESLAVFEKGR